MKDSDLILHFLQKIKVEDGLSQNTVNSYRLDLKQLKDFCKKKKVTLPQLQIKNFENYLLKLHNKELAPASIARSISTFKSFYRFLCEEKTIKNDPTINLEPPKLGLKLPKMLSLEEIRSLIATTKSQSNLKLARANCMIEILYATGLRVSELVTLELANLQRDQNGNIKEYFIVRGKGNKERMVILNEHAIRSIQNYLKVLQLNRNRDSKWLFPGRSAVTKDSHITRQAFNKLLKEAARLANIDEEKVHPHVLRHSFASHLLNNGADLRVLQELLGHSDISTTQIYTHVMDSKLKDLVFNAHPLAKVKK